jgi:anti-sigma regulatory factor (Ser/Thr protein kinase)
MSTVTATLPRESDSIGVARAFVDAHSPRLTVARREDARLMVSELVTNALRHGAGVIGVRVTTGRHELTIEVSDEGSGSVEMSTRPDAAGGWGLRIVDELAEAWGTESGSTRVWFRVLLSRS